VVRVYCQRRQDSICFIENMNATRLYTDFP